MFIMDEGNLVFEIQPKSIDTRNGKMTVVNNRMAFNNYSRTKKGYATIFVDVSFIGQQADFLVEQVLKNDKSGKNGKGARLSVGGIIVENEYKSNKTGEMVKSLVLEPDFVKFAKARGTGNGNGNSTSNASNNQSQNQNSNKNTDSSGDEGYKEIFTEFPDLFETDDKATETA